MEIYKVKKWLWLVSFINGIDLDIFWFCDFFSSFLFYLFVGLFLKEI